MAATVLDASLLALLVHVTVTDIRARLIPDRVLVAAALIALPLAGVSDPGGLPERFGWALGAGAFLLAAALARPGGMGLGDVKLGAVLGIYLGRSVVVALLIAFVLGSLFGAALIARYGWRARSRTIPFAPFLALGTLAAAGLWSASQP
jgi:leader peptidase (prepilin peptidase) / N-methyltransferase